jgi:hypothetical protein
MKGTYKCDYCEQEFVEFLDSVYTCSCPHCKISGIEHFEPLDESSKSNKASVLRTEREREEYWKERHKATDAYNRQSWFGQLFHADPDDMS